MWPCGALLLLGHFWRVPVARPTERRVHRGRIKRKDMPSENLIFKMNFERELTELIDKYLRPDTSSLQWSLVNDVLDETLRKLEEGVPRTRPKRSRG
jgi:hypothetical protein